MRVIGLSVRLGRSPSPVLLLMEEHFQNIARIVALTVEFGAAVFVAIGALEAFFVAVPAAFARDDRTLGARRRAWKLFGTWLMLALEFELAADIIRSAIAPTWIDIGQLASIAVIRTFLNYFLERDLSSDQETATKKTVLDYSSPSKQSTS